MRCIDSLKAMFYPANRFDQTRSKWSWFEWTQFVLIAFILLALLFPIDSTNATIEITTMTWEVVNCTIDDFDSYEDELLFEAPEKAPESLSFGVMLFTFTIIVVMLIMLLRLVVSFKPLNYRVVSNE
ncbi:hypothetical protein M3Y98_00170500 [Aphelenchoides besseyi]|nr:hypothetical protein M3Y98_00170500 [Aphelenchoides besseyi]